MADGILEVKNLRTYFYTDEGVVKAVDDVSFSLHKGEVIVIVGESGSGQSARGRGVLSGSTCFPTLWD